MIYVIPRQSIKREYVAPLYPKNDVGYRSPYKAPYGNTYYGDPWYEDDDNYGYQQKLLPPFKTGKVRITVIPTRDEENYAIQIAKNTYGALSQEQYAVEDVISNLKYCEFEGDLTKVAYDTFQKFGVMLAHQEYLLELLFDLIRE